MSFSLPQGFEQLKTKKPYFHWKEMSVGEHRFRIVQTLIGGWLDWDITNKPHRFRVDQKPKKPLVQGKEINPFWAAYVWDYAREGLYIMEITQAGIKGGLENLALNADWGDLTTFDFVIKKEVKGGKNAYTIIAIPHKPMSQAIKDALAVSPVRLEALYEGKDPWTDLTPSETPISDFKGISESQSAQLDTLLGQIKDLAFKQQLEEHLQVTSIHNIAEQDFSRAIRALENHINSKKTKTQEQPHDKRRMA